jgi:hypothetical protein
MKMRNGIVRLMNEAFQKKSSACSRLYLDCIEVNKST